jgi:hypothetical protein
VEGLRPLKPTGGGRELVFSKQILILEYNFVGRSFSNSRENIKRLDTPSAGKRGRLLRDKGVAWAGKARWDTLNKIDNSKTQAEIY